MVDRELNIKSPYYDQYKGFWEAWVTGRREDERTDDGRLRHDSSFADKAELNQTLKIVKMSNKSKNMVDIELCIKCDVILLYSDFRENATRHGTRIDNTRLP